VSTAFPPACAWLLDLYGTNHDPRIWEHPEEFDPGRFDGSDPDAFAFVPQGGGEHWRTHRCPGEWLTVELMHVAARFLRDELDYDVPPQDLRLRPSRMPPRPESGFVIRPRKTRRPFDTHLTRNTTYRR
jgi:fatty-acid peroxygenase